MAITYCIVGASGTGKSTSFGNIPELDIEGLDPKKTALINIMGKPLPFKNYTKMYSRKISDGGNYAAIIDSSVIIEALRYIKTRQDIKYIILDDFQYVMANDFMNKALEKGFDKFSRIGKNTYDILMEGKNLRDDQHFICITHSELDAQAGSFKVKTIGRMLDEKVTLEGIFTIVIYSDVQYNDKEKTTTYQFITNRCTDLNGNTIPAKSPFGMFDELYIKNDMGYVVKRVEEYFGIE